MNDTGAASAFDRQQRADAHVLTALLQASARVFGVWSLGLCALAVVLLLALPASFWQQALMWAVLLLGAAERYLAFRLVLDQGLFAGVAQQVVADLAALDASLARAGLRAPTAVPRAWVDRLQGTRRLLKQHAALAVLQTGFFLFFIWTYSSP